MFGKPHNSPRPGVTLPIFPVHNFCCSFLCFILFANFENSVYSPNVTPIFDRCPVAVTPVKDVCDSNDLAENVYKISEHRGQQSRLQ